MNHFLKIFENKIIILFFIIISCIISIFSYNGDIGDIIKNKKTFSKSNFQFVDFFRSPKTLLSKFDNNLVKTLAYLGLNQFVIGLIENKIPEYEDIFLVDSEMFIPKVLNGNLGTSSTSLIQGTIDFLSFKLNKNINLFVNGVLKVVNINKYSPENVSLTLAIKNDRNHFFINSFDDTKADGYCFFHAIISLIEKEIPEWKNIVFSNNYNQKILTDEQIKKKLNYLNLN